VSLMPGIHRLVTITDLDGREYCSRVEDVGDGVLVFARPLTLPLEHQFEVGQPLLASWPDPEGLTLATVTLLETRVHEHLGLWLTAVEDLRRQQRRQFVRVQALGPIELLATGGDPGEPFPHVAGHLLDVSEAALRCTLHTADAEALLAMPGLLASFALADARFTVPASMLRIEPARKESPRKDDSGKDGSRRDGSLTDCVLTFDIDDRDAAELRRLVFAEQLRLRRTRVAGAS